MENMSPDLVLQNLAEFCNTWGLTNKQLWEISEKFCPLESFYAFKTEVTKDETRTAAIIEINGQLDNLFEEVQSLDNSRRNLLND